MQKTYKLLDSGEQKKLEQIGDFVVARPSPFAVWTKSTAKKWSNCDAEYERYPGGKGEWKFINKNIKREFQIEVSNIIFNIKFTNFGHIGVFPEQASNWIDMQSQIDRWVVATGCQPEILNLFAYTGGSSIACALAGAKVTHVDAVKSVVDWAKQNALANAVPQDKIRWIVDDAVKFVRREITRGKKYDGIILDPPSHGHGPRGENFIIEDQIIDLLQNLRTLLSDIPLFLNYTCHTPGFTGTTLLNQVESVFDKKLKLTCDELTIPDINGRNLPAGLLLSGV